MTVGMTPAIGAQPLPPGAAAGSGLALATAPTADAFASPLAPDPTLAQTMPAAAGGAFGLAPQKLPIQGMPYPGQVGQLPGQIGQFPDAFAGAPMKLGGPMQAAQAPMKFPGGGGPVPAGGGMCACCAAATTQAGGAPVLLDGDAMGGAAAAAAVPADALAGGPVPLPLPAPSAEPKTDKLKGKLPIDILEDADKSDPVVPGRMDEKLTGRDALGDVLGTLLGGKEDLAKVKNRKDGGPTDFAMLTADSADVAKDDFNAGTVRNDLAALMDGDSLADA